MQLGIALVDTSVVRWARAGSFDRARAKLARRWPAEEVG